MGSAGEHVNAHNSSSSSFIINLFVRLSGQIYDGVVDIILYYTSSLAYFLNIFAIGKLGQCYHWRV